MRNIIVLAIIALLVAGFGTRLAEKFAPAPLANGSGNSGVRNPDARNAGAPATRAPQANMLTVASGRDGHFRLDGSVRGRAVAFLVDTGATIVALTKRDADRLGLNPAPRDYSVKIQTANGAVMAARVRLAALAVGPLTVHDVDAVVMPEGALTENLLGMTFLSRLRRFEFRSGQLVLEQ